MGETMTVKNFHRSKLPKRNRKQRRSRLLGAACAGLLSAGIVSSDPVAADLVNESTYGDFGDEFSLSSPLPFDTCDVVGTVANDSSQDLEDFFRFEDLEPESIASIEGAYSFDPPFQIFFTLFDSSENELASGLVNDIAMDVVVPMDGVLVGQMSFGGEGTGIGGYSFNINAQSVPEPEAAGILALGAAGLLGQRRKKKRWREE
jgi:hypothetical protein